VGPPAAPAAPASGTSANAKNKIASSEIAEIFANTTGYIQQ
jgi:hypothetical protein